MIKDVIVNLEHEIARDLARDFAITVAEDFDTHVTGLAFACIPESPGYLTLNSTRYDGRREREAARSAIERFDAPPDAAWFPPSIVYSRH